MTAIAYRRFATRAFDCLYRADRFANADDVEGLLADGASVLFAGSQPIKDKPEVGSYRVEIGGKPHFAKRFTTLPWYQWWRKNGGPPASFRQLAIGSKLLKAGLPAPVPLLAAVLKEQEPRPHLIVTDFCCGAVAIDDFARRAELNLHETLIPELAELLADVHRKGFFIDRPATGNILVKPASNGLPRQYWFSGLDRVSRLRFGSHRSHAMSTAHAIAGLYWQLPHKDRRFLLASCFDFALKKNIYGEPSQEAAFVEVTLSQLQASKPPEEPPVTS